MLSSPARRAWPVCLIIALLPVVGCSRGGPQAPGAINIVNGFNVANMEKAEETITKNFKTGAAPKIIVETFNGHVTITAGEDGAVRASVTKYTAAKTKAEAEEMLKDVTINFTEENDDFRVAASVPGGKSINSGASAKLEVPVGASLELETNLGPVEVTGVHGAIAVKDSQGTIKIIDGKGELDLVTRLAPIDVSAASAKVVANNSQGSITIHGATGTLDLTTTLAPIHVDAPCTNINAKNSQGGIRIHGATGALNLITTLAPIDVDAACGHVSAKNSQGSITINKAKGPLKLHTNLANITVHADGAELEAVNSQGAISAHGLKGHVKATTRLAPITIEAKDALVDAENGQGAVTFTGNLAAGKHSFRSSLAGVTLNLPASASFRLDAQVSLGRIRNAFALSQKAQASDTHVLGAVGHNPAAVVQVNVSQGDVVINKH